MLAIVEDDLEHPAGSGNLGRGQKRRSPALAVQQGDAIAIADVFEVAIDLAPRVGIAAAVGLMGLSQVEIRPIFGLIVVEDGVAAVVARLADEPGEDAPGVGRVGDARITVRAVESEDVVLGNRAPVNVAGVRPVDLRPTFDAGE